MEVEEEDQINSKHRDRVEVEVEEMVSEGTKISRPNPTTHGLHRVGQFPVNFQNLSGKLPWEVKLGNF